MRIGFASETSIVSPRNCRMRMTRAPSKNWQGILRRTQSQTKRPARSTVPNHVARDSTEARPTQRPRSHTAPKVKGETKEAREYSLGNAHVMWRNSEEPTSHAARDAMHIISPNGKRSNKTRTNTLLGHCTPITPPIWSKNQR